MSDLAQSRAAFGGQTIVVTGAAAGNGRAIADAFVQAGGTVVAVDVSDRLDRTVAELAATAQGPGAIEAVRGDVGDPELWSRVVRAVDEHGPRRTVLVNNAGVYRRGAVDELSLDDLDLLYRVNQRAPLLSAGALRAQLALHGGGAIVNVSSTAGITGDPFISAYSGTKWAVRGITRSLAAELGPHGIRVNAVIPGLFDTAMAAANGPEVNAAILDRTFLGRIGQPPEIAPAVLFLASTESGYVTGAELVVDAGLSV